MKKQLVLVTLVLFTAASFAKTPGLPQGFKQQQNQGISFTENKGQVHDQNYKPSPDVLYGAMAGNMAVHIKNNGISYQLYKVDSYKEVESIPAAGRDPKIKEKHREIDQQTIYRIDLSWLNHNPHFTTTEDEALPGYSNYYLPSCPDGALNVKSYKGVTLKNLYKGIDLHYYEKSGELKHDYIVAPHTDYKQIQVQLSGADISIDKDGSLILSTPLGKVQEGAPIVFQNGKSLKAKWQVKNNTLSFEIENYNPGYELIIDPVTRLWGTYYGGTGNDAGSSSTTDASGNIYMTGYTNSNTSIATGGAHQTLFSGNYDTFLAKFNGGGARQWATYYGGTGDDLVRSCVTDAGGNVYITGYTNSNTGTLATPGSHQPIFGGGINDAFLVKFNNSGVRQWGTYYGDMGVDYGASCTTDASGNVYITGFSSSNVGIATGGSHQSTYAGTGDAFLIKFNSSGVRQWGTYYGGVGFDYGASCLIDAGGNIYITGYSGSNAGTAIATPGSHQPTYGGGTYDAFLVKFNSSGIRQWGTYYGEPGDDGGAACASDAAGNVYVCGYTDSNTGLLGTTGSHQPAYGGGSLDAFLVKFNSGGIRQWGTYYGGTGYDYGSCCVTDASGNVYASGLTDSNTDIASGGSYQPVYGSGTYDAFLLKFNTSGVRQWGTYYGETGDDEGYSCATDATGNVYLAGLTDSFTGTVIATGTSHQPVFGGGGQNFDGFLVKFDVCDLPPAQPSVINGPISACVGAATSYSTPAVIGAHTYTWSLPAGWSGSGNTNTISATPGSPGVFTLEVSNACGVSPQQTLHVTVNIPPTITANNGTICSGQSFTIVASGANTYTYSGGMVVSPLVTSSYSVTGTSTAGCVSSNTAVSTVSVNPLPGVNASTTSTLLCAGEEATLTASGASSYIFNPGGAGTSITITPGATSTYTVTGSDANGCSNTATITQNVDACTGVNSLLPADHSPPAIYPNPTEGIIHLALDSDHEIIVINAIGQMVFSSKFSAGTHQINLEHLAKGVYLVKVENAVRSENFKMIKE